MKSSKKKTSLHSPPPIPHPYRITLIKKHQSKKIIPSKLQLRLRHSLNDGKRAKYPLTEREVMPMVPNGRWNLEWKWKSRHFCFRKFNQSLGICFGVVLFDDFPWWLKWMMKAFYTIHLPPPVAVALLAATVFPFFYSFIIFFQPFPTKFLGSFRWARNRGAELLPERHRRLQRGQCAYYKHRRNASK